ncbi:MAG: ABC transporter ATP-binding protein [Micrococcales bacterium]
MEAVIELRDLTFSFEAADTPILRRVNLRFEAGEFALICGPTGSGKSTLLAAINGLIPHFSSGQISGQVIINGTDMSGKKPREFAEQVGYVNQGPEVAFVAHTVAEELAFGMEQLGFAPESMIRKVAEVARQFSLSDFLEKPLHELSGGQQQRVAMAASLAAGQRILLLDEPTSSLDPDAAAELLALLRTLATEQGITILLVEHRIERVLEITDSVTVVSGDGSALKAYKRQGLDPVLRSYRMVPPLLELGQTLGWSPLPLSINEAKKRWQENPGLIHALELAKPEHTALSVENLEVCYGARSILENLSLEIRSGEITCLLGSNGSGKTTLLLAIQGALISSGKVTLLPEQVAPQELKPSELIKHLAMVPQAASDLLVLTSVSKELEASDLQSSLAPGTTGNLFAKLAGRINPNRHPRDLSAGQQLALVLAIQLSKGAKILLLDEPTRGLDYQSKRVLAGQLALLKAGGSAVFVASNDVEFVALVADRVLNIAHGQILQEDSAPSVLSELGRHAPQLYQITQQAIRLEQIEAKQ